jgi:hypothetical protein
VADLRRQKSCVTVEETNMRLTILAGLIMGASLAIQSIYGAHIRARVGIAVKPAHVHEVAPWYIADARNDASQLAGTRDVVRRA